MPRGFSETHSTVFEPRLGIAYRINQKTALRLGGGIYHTRIQLNDSTLLGGNPPIQFKVGVTNGIVDQPAGATARRLPAGDDRCRTPSSTIRPPTTGALSVQRELPLDVVADVTYVGRMGLHLQRERNINQLQPGTVQANPGVNVNALRPYLGFATIRLSENAGRSIYNGLQLNLERRFRNGLGFGVAYTSPACATTATTSATRSTTPTTTAATGPSPTTTARTCSTSTTSTSCPSGASRTRCSRRSWAAGRSPASPTTSRVGRSPSGARRTSRASATPRPSPGTWSATPHIDNPQFSNGRAVDQNFWFNPAAFARPAAGTFGNGGRNPAGLRGPAFQS